MEFENLLTSQESLVRQMVRCSISRSDGDALFSSKNKFFNKEKDKGKALKIIITLVKLLVSMKMIESLLERGMKIEKVSSVTDVINLDT